MHMYIFKGELHIYCKSNVCLRIKLLSSWKREEGVHYAKNREKNNHWIKSSLASLSPCSVVCVYWDMISQECSKARRLDPLYRLIMRNEKRFAWWEWKIFRRRPLMLGASFSLSLSRLLGSDASDADAAFVWESEASASRCCVGKRWLIRPRPGQITPEFTAPRNWSSVTQIVVIWVIFKLHTLFRIYWCARQPSGCYGFSALRCVCNWKLCGGARSCENFDGKHSSVQQCILSRLASRRMRFIVWSEQDPFL